MSISAVYHSMGFWEGIESFFIDKAIEKVQFPSNLSGYKASETENGPSISSLWKEGYSFWNSPKGAFASQALSFVAPQASFVLDGALSVKSLFSENRDSMLLIVFMGAVVLLGNARLEKKLLDLATRIPPKRIERKIRLSRMAQQPAPKPIDMSALTRKFLQEEAWLDTQALRPFRILPSSLAYTKCPNKVGDTFFLRLSHRTGPFHNG